jgi:hypothetical protein
MEDFIMARHPILAFAFLTVAAAAFLNPLPAQEERPKLLPVEARVNTAGKEKMAWWINSYNNTAKNVKAFKTDGALIIALDVDMDAWGKVPAVNECFPLLVRVFDQNGQYLTHFITAAGFTANQKIYNDHYGVYEGFARAGVKPPADVRMPILLKAKDNVLSYGVNRRDLRDAAIIEVGFFETPR